ncbi:MAG: WcbI family polysaccharide biosynthesis putative acetyltransferase [Butyrivibrio sp.]
MKKNVLEIREIVKRRLQNGNIILWGYNEKAKAFYHKYKDIFNIKGCVTEQREHPAYLLDEIREMPIVKWDEYKGEENDYVIVFAAPFVHIENQILASGLVVFEEYVDSTLAEYVLSGKKIAIVSGNCQIATICDFLQEVKSFTDEYMVFRFSTHYWKSRYSLKSLSYLRSMCDLYICMQHEEDDIHFFSQEELPETCKIVRVPSALLRLYWPQMKVGRENSQNEFFMKDKSYKQHGPFEYGDANINRMMVEGMSVNEVIKRLEADDFYSEEQVKKHINMVFRTLEYEEEGCDIKISDFIMEKYCEKMLYRDMTHMQPVLIWEMVKRILQYLNMDTTEAEEMNQTGCNAVEQSYNAHCTQIPIYPSVAKHMGLAWYCEDIRYDVTFYNGLRKMTFEEYIRSYWEVCGTIKRLREEW